MVEGLFHRNYISQIKEKKTRSERVFFICVRNRLDIKDFIVAMVAGRGRCGAAVLG